MIYSIIKSIFIIQIKCDLYKYIFIFRQAASPESAKHVCDVQVPILPKIAASLLCIRPKSRSAWADGRHGLEALQSCESVARAWLSSPQILIDLRNERMQAYMSVRLALYSLRWHTCTARQSSVDKFNSSQHHH